MNRFLGKMKKRVLAACLSAALMATSAAWAALPEIISLRDLKPGMWGTGYTVIDSSGEIKPFDVQVVGVLGDNSKMSSKRILVNLYGPLIEETGGAISGMSGSPIYFDGKLAGALSAGYKDMYPTMRIMLTPIEDMLKIWDYPDSRNKTAIRQLDLKQLQEDKEKFQKEQEEKADKEPALLKAARERLAKEEAEKAEAEKTAENAENTAGPENGQAVQSENQADTEGADADEAAGSLVQPGQEQTVAAVADETAVGAEASEAMEAVEAVEAVEADSQVAAEEAESAYRTRAAIAAEKAENAEAAADGARELPSQDDGSSPLEEKTAYFASGFGWQGMELLQEKMSGLGLKINLDNVWDNGASMMQAYTGAVLQPGSPVGVAMSIGDFTFGSLGTVTAVDGDRILAFGHSYTHRGNVNYFMTDASVVSTIHGPTAGMKLGTVSGIIGRINQDRQDGIAGIIGKFPQTVPVIVTVHDRDTNRDITYNTMVAYDEEVLQALAPVVVYSAMNASMDRQDSTTADLAFALRSSYGPDGLIERRNMFFDTEDVAKSAITELNDILSVIMGNREKEPDVLDLKVDVTLERGRKTALLVSAVPSKKEVFPGESITLETTLKPYRGTKQKVLVPYTVPETQQPGDLTLDIHGGGLVNVTKILLAQQQAADEGQLDDQEPPVDVQLQDMLASNCNNEIVVESAVSVPKNDAELKESIKRAKKQAEKLAKQKKAQPMDVQPMEPPVNKVSTDYIIENVIHANIKVVEKK